MTASLGLLTDGLLALLLLVTIGYAVVLNRKLSALRDLRGDLERVVADFAEASREAERSVAELRGRAETLAVELKEQVGSAAGRLEEVRSLNDDLRFLIEKGQGLADRLERGVVAASRRPAPAPAAVEPRPVPAARAERPRPVAVAAMAPSPPAAVAAAAGPARPPAGEAAADDPARRRLIDALDAIR